jgi:hypothetical protein
MKSIQAIFSPPINLLHKLAIFPFPFSPFYPSLTPYINGESSMVDVLPPSFTRIHIFAMTLGYISEGGSLLPSNPDREIILSINSDSGIITGQAEGYCECKTSAILM